MGVIEIILWSLSLTAMLTTATGVVRAGYEGKLGVWVVSTLLFWINAGFFLYRVTELVG